MIEYISFDLFYYEKLWPATEKKMFLFFEWQCTLLNNIGDVISKRASA